jgi:hypothetical protein
MENDNNEEIAWADDSSSDESWTPSVESEDSIEDDHDWVETPFSPGHVRILFDSTDELMTENYIEETTQIKARLLDEVKAICSCHFMYCNEEYDEQVTVWVN